MQKNHLEIFKSLGFVCLPAFILASSLDKALRELYGNILVASTSSVSWAGLYELGELGDIIINPFVSSFQYFSDFNRYILVDTNLLDSDWFYYFGIVAISSVLLHRAILNTTLANSSYGVKFLVLVVSILVMVILFELLLVSIIFDLQASLPNSYFDVLEFEYYTLWGWPLFGSFVLCVISYFMKGKS